VTRVRTLRRLLVMLAIGGLAVTGAACATSSKPTASTTSVPHPPSPPTGSVVPTGFEPGSVSFVSTTTGFVLGIDSSCPADTCVALARSTDGGSSWVALPAPIAGYVAHGASSTSSVPVVSEVRFADELDGWVFGPALFATHNGGRTWEKIDLGGSVVALETSGGYVDAVVSACRGEAECAGPLTLEQAPATGDAFTTVLTGPSTESSGGDFSYLSLHAPVGFVILSGADRSPASLYATENLANPWHALPDPCASVVPSYLASMVAPNSTVLYSLCTGPGAAGSSEKSIVLTENGVATVVGSAPTGGASGVLAATSSGTLALATASGASWLFRSSDGGHTWSTAETYSDGGIGFNDLGLTTSTLGTVVHGIPGPPANYQSQLLMTHDAGASWQPVPIG